MYLGIFSDLLTEKPIFKKLGRFQNAKFFIDVIKSQYLYFYIRGCLTCLLNYNFCGLFDHGIARHS